MRDIIFDLFHLGCSIVMIVCLIKLIAIMKKREEEKDNG